VRVKDADRHTESDAKIWQFFIHTAHCVGSPKNACVCERVCVCAFLCKKCEFIHNIMRMCMCVYLWRGSNKSRFVFSFVLADGHVGETHILSK